MARIFFLSLILRTAARCQSNLPMSSHFLIASSEPASGHFGEQCKRRCIMRKFSWRGQRNFMSQCGIGWRSQWFHGGLYCLLDSSFQVPSPATTGGTLGRAPKRTSQSRNIFYSSWLHTTELSSTLQFDRRLSWLGHVLRMPEHRLVRRVLPNYVKPTHETLFADVPYLNVDYAIRMSEDRKLWRSDRPSLRCQPLLGELQ